MSQPVGGPSPLAALHLRCFASPLSRERVPPLWRGTTWSNEMASSALAVRFLGTSNCVPQPAHKPPCALRSRISLTRCSIRALSSAQCWHVAHTKVIPLAQFSFANRMSCLGTLGRQVHCNSRATLDHRQLLGHVEGGEMICARTSASYEQNCSKVGLGPRSHMHDPDLDHPP